MHRTGFRSLITALEVNTFFQLLEDTAVFAQAFAVDLTVLIIGKFA